MIQNSDAKWTYHSPSGLFILFRWFVLHKNFLGIFPKNISFVSSMKKTKEILLETALVLVFFIQGWFNSGQNNKQSDR
jgi:hypothetical protein